MSTKITTTTSPSDPSTTDSTTTSWTNKEKLRKAILPLIIVTLVLFAIVIVLYWYDYTHEPTDTPSNVKIAFLFTIVLTSLSFVSLIVVSIFLFKTMKNLSLAQNILLDDHNLLQQKRQELSSRQKRQKDLEKVLEAHKVEVVKNQKEVHNHAKNLHQRLIVPEKLRPSSPLKEITPPTPSYEAEGRREGAVRK